MEYTENPRPRNPRRKKRTKMQIFKEAYLPMIIVAVTFVLLLVFIIGGISRNSSADQPHHEGGGTSQPTQSTSSTSNLTALLEAEAEELMARAALLLDDYDYAGALAILDTFSGDIAAFPKLSQTYAQYQAALDEMVEWTGDQVVNLSFHLLIEDPQRAFHDDIYGSQYRKNFITTTEFSAILQQLYDNGYILVSLSDLYEIHTDEVTKLTTCTAKTLLLPPGKTPVLLTETNANYYTYMTDSNGNGKPDANADGFAYKLCYGENGFYNEIVLADGSVVAGAFDIVPLLENFIAAHPDFSYRNARAIIAVTGYDGVLGYRINTSKLTEAEKEAERASVAALVAQLKATGYDIACFTYENWNYAEKSATEIQSDLQKWEDTVASVIGPTNILVLPKEGDIAGTESYDGNSKYNVMYNAGYCIFLGTGTVSWDQVDERYVRHNRLMVTGSYLTNYPERFADLFDAASVLDPYRANFN